MTSPGELMNAVRLCRGQTKVLNVVIKDQGGQPANLGAATLYFTVRETPTSSVLICLTSAEGGGIVITDAQNGLATITISSTDSDVEKGTYKYDLWVEYAGDPPVRYPVVKNAEFCVTASVISFDCS